MNNIRLTYIGIFLTFLVLSACETSNKTSSKTAGNTGLKMSFEEANKKAAELVEQMSLDEKTTMLHGFGGGNSEFGDLDVRFFGIAGNERLGIPPLYMGHGLTGVRSGRDTSIHATYFYSPVAMGCSWDTKLYGKVGTAVAKEMRALGQDLNLGPTLNIIRHPLGGRNWESLSEDPYLTSRLVVPYVKAMQANGIVAGPKHFVANNQETNRFDINNEVDERTLNEIYLPAFKASVVEGGALNIMGAYNRINGSFMCQNKELLTHVLRDKWNFEGFVLSDFVNGIRDTKKAIDAGCNVEMHRPKFYKDSLIALVEKGDIAETRVDELVTEVISVMYRIGAMDRERYENPEVLGCKEHLELCREVARKSPVLLKNDDNILPLKNIEKKNIAIIGPNAKRFASLPNNHSNFAYYLQGGGSGRTYYFVNRVVSPWQGMLNAYPNVNFSYAQGCKTPDTYEKNKPSSFDKEEQEYITEAVKKAQNADMTILYVGLSGFNETEGWDRANYDLVGEQNRLIKAVSAVNPNTVVVLIAGSSVNVEPWINDVKALLYVPYCGEQLGNGVADVLSGKSNPSGKLPFTWSISTNDYPTQAIFRGKGFSEEGISNQYAEGVFVGYRWFEKEEIPVRYPFGYGLSYTRFEYHNLKVENSKGFPKKISFEVSNKGKVAGEEIVQLYVLDKESSVTRPNKELKAFQKVMIPANESVTVQLELSKDAFSFYDTISGDWVMEPGKFEILIGSSSQDIHLKAEI